MRVFVMGVNRWRTSDRWPLAGAHPDTFYLTGDRGKGSPGLLVRRAPGSGAGTTVILSDPARFVTDPFNGKFGAHDYRSLVPSPGIAVFETPAFSTPVEIIGQVVIELAASATVPDFDLWAQLYDVSPDGATWNLSTPGTSIRRASFREGGPERRLVRSGETVRLRMDRMVTANRFLPGHRLRLVITPQFYPLFSINPQTGAQEFESDSVRAGEIRIEHSADRVSCIVLPVVPIAE